MVALEAHAKPPEQLLRLFKRYRRASVSSLQDDNNIVDFCRGLTKEQSAHFQFKTLSNSAKIESVFTDYLGFPSTFSHGVVLSFSHQHFPGLCVVPSLIPLDVQKTILSRTLNRDLCNSQHKTNVHFHHDLVYPERCKSFFDCDPDCKDFFVPKDPTVHKPLSVKQVMDKKLRWITLGGQYDWTKKKYPEEEPPAFPEDLRALLLGLFPSTDPQAAIVNFYSPGDQLSLHRDVSEMCDRGLISISIGCDGLFVLALEDTSCSNPELHHLVLRLRSGDVVYMSDVVRYAWHGVPLVTPDTCPDELSRWPATSDLQRADKHSDTPDAWEGWIASKRVNLNVRQIRKISNNIE